MASGRKTGFSLLCSGDLSGYVFRDKKHAREWLSQRFVADPRNRYGLAKVSYRERACCGKIYGVKQLSVVDVPKFLESERSAKGGEP